MDKTILNISSPDVFKIKIVIIAEKRTNVWIKNDV